MRARPLHSPATLQSWSLEGSHYWSTSSRIWVISLESCSPQNRRTKKTLFTEPQNISFLQTLAFKQSKDHPDICHPTNHVIQFKSSISICMLLKGMKAFPRHHVEWKSTWLVPRGASPHAALPQHSQQAELPLGLWLGAELLISHWKGHLLPKLLCQKITL